MLETSAREEINRDKARANGMLETGLNAIIFISFLFILATYLVYSRFDAILVQQGSDGLAYQFGPLHYGFIGIFLAAVLWRICLMVCPSKCAVYKNTETQC